MRYGPCYCDIKLDNEGIEILNRFLENSDLTLTDSVLAEQKHSDVSKNIRSSKNAWIKDPEFFQFFYQICSNVNRMSGWNFGIDATSDVQYGVYDVGDYYGWHADGFAEPFQKEGPLKGKIRKLSMCVSLSKPEDYKGGELELDLSTPDKKNIEVAPMQEQGSVVVFPSHVQHRVKPVTQGTRYSLVAWFCGNAFV